MPGRGLWDDLSPAELAACVSALSFESRQADDAQPPRLAEGRVPEALSATVRTWGELDQLEKDNELSFLREPDLGFAWAAYRWARGARLETVLDESPDLTPGDFVRSVKQLIDLLDQIASAPPATPAPPTTRHPAPGPGRDGPRRHRRHAPGRGRLFRCHRLTGLRGAQAGRTRPQVPGCRLPTVLINIIYI